MVSKAGTEAVMHGVCGVSEALGDGSAVYKLATNRPLVLIQDRLPGFSHDEIYNWIDKAFLRWSAVCNMQHRRVASQSDVTASDVLLLVTVDDLGSGGILADQRLPSPGVRILPMRINSRIKWKVTDGPMQGGTIDPIRTLCHEIGHFMGHQHWPTGLPAELMEPVISNTIIVPQPTEARMSAGWFGEPVPIPGPMTPIPPSPTTETIIRIRGNIADIRIDNWSVTRTQISTPAAPSGGTGLPPDPGLPVSPGHTGSAPSRKRKSRK